MSEISTQKFDHISNITAEGPFVKISMASGDVKYITRKDALLRAQSLVGLDSISMDIAEALIKAANQALINETGKGYTSQALNFMLNDANKTYKHYKKYLKKG